MKAIIAALCILTIASAANIPPVKDFSLTDLQGLWQITGSIGLEKGYYNNFSNLPNILCPSVLFSLVNRTTIIGEEVAYDLDAQSVKTKFRTYTADSKNNAILNDGKHQLIIGYYNAETGVIAAVSSDEKLVYVLTRDEYEPNFDGLETFFSACQPPINVKSLFKTDNRVCEGPDYAIHNFNATQLNGYYYVNGRFSSSKQENTDCELAYFEESAKYKGMFNVTIFSQGKVVSTDYFLPLPGRSAQFVPGYSETGYVFGYENPDKGDFAFVSGDQKEALLISKTQKLGLVELARVVQYFLTAGLDIRKMREVKNTCSLPKEFVF